VESGGTGEGGRFARPCAGCADVPDSSRAEQVILRRGDVRAIAGRRGKAGRGTRTAPKSGSIEDLRIV
jgi:hypothetical protein